MRRILFILVTLTLILLVGCVNNLKNSCKNQGGYCTSGLLEDGERCKEGFNDTGNNPNLRCGESQVCCLPESQDQYGGKVCAQNGGYCEFWMNKECTREGYESSYALGKIDKSNSWCASKSHYCCLPKE